jgi:hypothetical protein
MTTTSNARIESADPHALPRTDLRPGIAEHVVAELDAAFRALKDQPGPFSQVHVGPEAQVLLSAVAFDMLTRSRTRRYFSAFRHEPPAR